MKRIGSSVFFDSTGIQAQTYKWDKPYTVPKIHAGSCSHGEQVALWFDAGKRTAVILAPFRTNWRWSHYHQLFPRYKNKSWYYGGKPGLVKL